MDKKILTQSALIKQYNDEHREKFNEVLFQRSHYDIIEEVKKVILSNQRDQIFSIKVDSFEVIEDYQEIRDILYKYEENIKSKRKKKHNPYEYVNLKDSDTILLKTNYTITVKDDSEKLSTYILIPRIVDKYYFKISGNYYSAMYQIADASTYNNSTSANAKVPVLTFKPISGSGSIKLSKKNSSIVTIDEEEIKCNYFNIITFNKSFNAFKYILAKFGIYGAMNLSGINEIYISNSKPEIDKDNFYIVNRNDIFIFVPKILYDNDSVVQSFFLCLVNSFDSKNANFNSIFTNEFWLEQLGTEYGSMTSMKGESLLYSIESLYDITTMENIKLPLEYKSDIYRIILWMMREFNSLRAKDNLDISIKRLNISSYIASLYAMKLASGIYRLSDANNRITTNQIIKNINIKPTFLLESITKCKLVNYRNLVNDLDSLIAIKYTYKKIAGMGDKNTRNVPTIIRYIHPSHLGRVDLDSSPKSDPGMSGILCPLTDIYDNNYFSKFEEPNFWEDEFSKVMDQYKSLTGLEEVFNNRQKLFNEDLSNEISYVRDSINTMKRLFIPIKTTTDEVEYHCDMTPVIVEGGNIYYEYE